MLYAQNDGFSKSETEIFQRTVKERKLDIEAFVPADDSAYKEAIAFAILFIMLASRPQGLLGRRLIQKV
nr:hypothetical protein [Chlorogloea sp. CCALA 695]